MAIYTNFICEHGTPGNHCPLMPLNFDSLEETWGDMVAFAQSHGWKFEGGPKQAEMKCWCPKHADEASR